jgi:two-component system, sensor histidine kinase
MLEHYEELTACVSSPDSTMNEKLQTICQKIKEIAPNANRVSLWLFNQEANEIFCLMCLESNGIMTNGQSLKKVDFPEYFDHILKNKVLSASDARDNPATACFNEVYFKPLNIFSLLDFIFHFQFKPTGVICCEREGDITQWSKDNINSLKRVANITSMFFSEEILSLSLEKEMILDAIKLN